MKIVLKIKIIIMSVFWAHQMNAQKVCESNFLAFEAEVNYRHKLDLPKAVELYKAAFQLNLTDGSKVLDAIHSATILKDTLSSIEFLRNGVSIGIPPSSIKNLWSHLGNGMDYEFLIAYVDTTNLINKYKSFLDTTLIYKLRLLAEKDQKFRGEEDFKWQLQRSIDSINWEELKGLVQKIGRLPMYKEIGLDGQENLEILFFHMDEDIIEWFLPYILKCVREDNSNLSSIILYQLDRIGMSEGLIYTITKDQKIEELTKRTKMKNGYYCQTFGEWFDEKSSINNKLYEIPIDPMMDLEEINRVRNMFCLDGIEQERSRKPWINVVTISEFEKMIKE